MGMDDDRSSAVPQKKRGTALPWCGVCCGSICILIAWVFAGLFVFDRHQSTLHKVVNSQAHTSTDQKFYDAWANHSEAAELVMYYWLWNVTNGEDVMVNGARPKVSPVGPFAYTQENRKEGIKFSDDGNLVEYKYRLLFHFDAERTAPGLTEQTQIFMPNLPSFGAEWRSARANTDQGGRISALNALSLQYHPAVNAPWQQKEIVNYTAWQWLWNITDPVVVGLDQTVRLLEMMGINLGVRVQPHDMLSLQFNNTEDMYKHTSSQWTGKDDVTKAGKMVHWEGCTSIGDAGKCGVDHRYWGEKASFDGCQQYKTKADCSSAPQKSFCDWDSFMCADEGSTGCCQASNAVVNAQWVNGTDGYQQPPHLRASDATKQIFLDQAWRTFELQRTGDCEYKGIKSCNEYSLSDESFYNEVQSNGANAGFLSSYAGMLNFSTVQAAPIYLSKPLFRGTPDPKVDMDTSAFPEWSEGCKDGNGKMIDACVSRDMDSYFQYEGWTGLGLGSNVGLQINLEIQDYTDEWLAICDQDKTAEYDCTRTGISGPYVLPSTSDGRNFSQGMQKAMYPMVTIKQATYLKQHFVDRLNKDVLNLVNGVILGSKILFPVLNVVGAVLLFFSLRALSRRRQKVVYSRIAEHDDEYCDEAKHPRKVME
eukprot:TRINITY_DN774_c0_g1_i14.p2 TRINITY_DN774_c0_g1~~TRINITY_DN774_c0_g1_i14.p2  ORF type:complete len:650 (+),score=265.49 TRINITY_DN774_c0_g1_i14:86-2035(+)